ncbi:MAG: NAD(P)-dependent oxidoreductase [Pseudomonadales bacterium]|jgi:predicted homoserine dehydrogenase-like protein|nr:NAD(P)-dependent oxidoreductase [Pseudomonadales bacterium]
MQQRARIGVAGTGFIATDFTGLALRHHPELEISSVLTRRPLAALRDFPAAERLTQSVDAFLEACDLVFECSGDPIHAAMVVHRAFEAGKPVVTMNTEFHVTVGSWFVGKGYLTEAEGDQPGCIAALAASAVSMGFQPLVYGNMKGFLRHDPPRSDMEYFAQRTGCSVSQITSFTDGTKLQIEQALVGNALGATITRQGMEGLREGDVFAAGARLGELATSLGRPITDYTLHGGSVPGVFVVCRHDEEEFAPLRHLKMGEGPYYTLVRNYHLCAFEAFATIRATLDGAPPLLNNSATPELGVAALAKRELSAGTRIERAFGGEEVRGEVVRLEDAPSHVPIGLLSGAVLRHGVETGAMLSWSDVDLPDSFALDCVRALRGIDA